MFNFYFLFDTIQFIIYKIRINNYMSDKVYVLDASAIIGGFSSKKSQNFITASVISEVKDFKSKLFLESAIEDGSITIMEPESLILKMLQM